MQGLAISFVALIQLLALVSAYQLGRQTATPVAKWPTGGILQFGWQAWRLPYWVIVGLAVALTVVLPLLKAAGLFTGFGSQYSSSGGGGGGMYGGGSMYQ